MFKPVGVCLVSMKYDHYYPTLFNYQFRTLSYLAKVFFRGIKPYFFPNKNILFIAFRAVRKTKRKDWIDWPVSNKLNAA